MFVLWGITAALKSPKSGASSEMTLFEASLLASRRWPSFLASLVLHATVILTIPQISLLFAERDAKLWIRRMKLVAPVEIRIPEVLYFASPGGKPAPRKPVQPPRVQKPAGRPPAPGQERVEAARAEPPAKPQRRFELPPLRRRESNQTLLQPNFDPDVPVLSEVRLPQVFFWAPMPAKPAARIRKPFVMPGHGESRPQAPRLNTPPRLEAPNWESLASSMRVAASPKGRPDSLLVAGTSMPIRTFDLEGPPPLEGYIAVDRIQGDPTSVLALSSRAKPVREELIVPPGNQLGRMPDEIGSQNRLALTERGIAGGSGISAAANDARPAPGTPSGGDSANSGDPGGKRRGPGGEGTAHAAVRLPAPAESSPSLPRPALRMVHPTNAVFDVVVVQTSPIEGLPESAGALSGRPVYSVFLQVGAPKEWIMQYCVPGEGGQDLVSNGGVVRLGNPSPLAAPYPRVTLLPPIQTRAGSYLMIHGFLDENGRFRDLRVLRSMDAEESKTVLPVLEQWEFRPAVREGRPVRVEILLAVPRT